MAHCHAALSADPGVSHSILGFHQRKDITHDKWVNTRKTEMDTAAAWQPHETELQVVAVTQ